ncbi:MAG: cytochrome P450 [Pseudomonadota bacterium]|nr:cytochrome P450 [Pseudomonadota bacterium]
MLDNLDLDSIYLGDPAFWDRHDRYDWLARFRRERPVTWQAGRTVEGFPTSPGFWSLTGHAEVRAVSRDTKRFTSEFGTQLFSENSENAYLTGGMLIIDPPRHTKLRKIVSRAFTPRMLQAIEQQMDRRARAVVGRVASWGACDFASDIATRMPMGVICDMMEVPEDDWLELQCLTIQALGFGDAEVGEFGDAFEAFMALNDYGEGLCRSRRKAPTEDLISALIAAEVDGERLSDLDVGIFFQLLITAGIETTSSSIAHGMAQLAGHPDQRADWMADYEGLVASALEEIVRYSSPVVNFARTATKDLELGGQAIAAGDKVVMWYTAANRDETVFEEPERFDIRRWPNDHVGYGGGGVHHCLGMHLARREMYHFFKILFETLPDLDVDLDRLVPINGLFIHGVRSLPCTFSPLNYRKMPHNRS